MTTATDKPRVWQRMLSGRRLDILDPSPLDIEIEDIAHGLARVARWNGQTTGEYAFSVAQHSLLVEEILLSLSFGDSPQWQMAALLHDAPEYVIGDMISPFKAVLGNDYKAIEERLQEAIHLRFSLPRELPSDVLKVLKSADKIAACLEATQLAGFTKKEAYRFFGVPPATFERKFRIVPLSTQQAQKAYLERFALLAGHVSEKT
jgi:hypothetical protein